MITRRCFVRSGALALFASGIGGIPAFVTRAAGSDKILSPYKKKKILVCIFQRGAMDGLMAVAPFEDKFLRKARPSLFMSAAKTAANPLYDLDGHFGLHPSLNSFLPYFQEKRLAIVHGVGSPNPTRSHFDAQDYMESGTPFKKGTPSGWLNRAVGLMGHETPFQAVSMTPSLPRSFYGNNSAVAISNLNDFGIRGNAKAHMAAESFEALYHQATSSLLNKSGRDTFEAVKVLDKAQLKNYKPEHNAEYPSSRLGFALRQIAQLIKMDVGLEIAFAETGGWDTHFNQGTTDGVFARNVDDLSKAISAFWTDLGSYQDDLTVMTMTEFGRTVAQNGSVGTDHGRGSCMFVLGNNVNGGAVLGQVPELAIENLEDRRDLPVTTDFRSVFNEVAEKHLNIHQTETLFPGWKGGEGLGVMKG